MIGLFLENMDRRIRNAVPMAVTVLMLLASVVIWPLPDSATLIPNFALMAVFYWSARQPEAAPPWFVFLLGLFYDALAHLPLGVSASLFLLAAGLVRTQRGILGGGAFLTLWAGFVLVMAVVLSLQWLLLCALSWTIFPLWPLLLQAVMAAALFPLVGGVLALLQRLIAE